MTPEDRPSPETHAHAWCIATCVSSEALAALLDAGTSGTIKTDHPWLMAREMLDVSAAAGKRLPLLLAAGRPLQLSYWAWIERIDVVEMGKGRWETACDFSGLEPVNPIWTELDAVLLKPGDDQLRRERLEPIRLHRQALDERHIRPYAICETPAFIAAAGKP